jgi:hypothetical protein
LGIGFFLLGIITMLATILSYQKRKSYLNWGRYMANNKNLTIIRL